MDMSKSLHFLISAGPTREKIDPVRFISNYSTGKMGYALANAAVQTGHKVTLVSGPVCLNSPENVTRIDVESASEMASEIFDHAKFADVIIMAAAVADYRPVDPGIEKIKKQDSDLILRLERTVDILKVLGENKSPDQILVGFAAESSHLLENALNKLQNKNLDWIIANDISRPDRGFASEFNAVTMIAKDGQQIEMELADKQRIAEKILSTILVNSSIFHP